MASMLFSCAGLVAASPANSAPAAARRPLPVGPGRRSGDVLPVLQPLVVVVELLGTEEEFLEGDLVRET